MSKLGYTWYPKDWNNSESVFELTLQQRGLYRELIDLAMLNDNKTAINLKTWSRKWDVSEEILSTLIGQLSTLGLLEVKENNLFIPSCESRLNLVRGGSKGGKNSKPTPKPNSKPIPKPTQKPVPNQIETKREKENKVNIKEELFNSSEWIIHVVRLTQTREEVVKEKLVDFMLEQEANENLDRPIKELKQHFLNWFRKQPEGIKIQQPKAGDPTTW
jgi:hypothetical protein